MLQYIVHRESSWRNSHSLVLLDIEDVIWRRLSSQTLLNLTFVIFFLGLFLLRDRSVFCTLLLLSIHFRLSPVSEILFRSLFLPNPPPFFSFFFCYLTCLHHLLSYSGFLPLTVPIFFPSGGVLCNMFRGRGSCFQSWPHFSLYLLWNIEALVMSTALTL